MDNIMQTETVFVMLSTLYAEFQWEFSMLNIILSKKLCDTKKLTAQIKLTALFQILIMPLFYENSDYSFHKFLSNAGV